MSFTTRFWNRTARRYAKQPIANQEAYEKKLAVTREYMTPESEVLEFGCGTGSTALSHAAFAAHIHATDLSSEMIAIAREKAREGGIGNVSFEETSLEAFDAEGKTYDVVLGLSLLHLLADWEGAIAKVWSLLKPGGVFVTNTVCIRGPLKAIRFVAPLGRVLGLLPLVRIVDPAKLRAAMTNAGFELVHDWEPEGGMVVFLVARKPEDA